jgi:recombinational DNA repair protein (RecF pathway)
VPENFSYEELVLFSQFLKILKNILSSPEEDVFFLLEKGFSFLFSSQRKKQVLYILFCKLLFTLGMLSDFRECAFSGTPLKNAPSLFFFPEGKITEEEKEGGREISQGTRKILASYEYASFLENSKIALSLKEEQEVERCIQEILEYHHL